MAWPIGRLWRVCMVGVGVCRRCGGVYGVGVRCYGVCMACVFGVQALGVRMVSVCVCVGCMCMVCVVCTLCVSFYDVVSI